jgi:hypothetical protein
MTKNDKLGWNFNFFERKKENSEEGTNTVAENMIEVRKIFLLQN